MTAYDTLQTAKAFIPCLKPRIAFISNPRHRTFPVDQVCEALQRHSISDFVSFFFAISLCVCVRVCCVNVQKVHPSEKEVCVQYKAYRFLSSEQETAILRVTVRRVEETKRSPIAQASHHESFY